MRIRIIFYDDDNDEEDDASLCTSSTPFRELHVFYCISRKKAERTMVAEKKSRTPLSIMACVESGRKGSSFIERGILEAPGLDV